MFAEFEPQRTQSSQRRKKCEDDQILCRKAMLLRYANVIFDHDRAPALRAVHGYLDDLGISYCGRYGDWGYLWTDESFKSGENAAQNVLNRLGAENSAKVAVATGF